MRFLFLVWLQSLLLLASLAGFASAAEASTPRFKWGQNKEHVFLSVIVRDLQHDSVQVSLLDGDVHFEAKNVKGEGHTLRLPLREDVEEDFKHEVAQRPDRWGTAVLITLTKVNKHRWDLLVQNPKSFKGLMDKDWKREDSSLEPEEEVPYLEDHSGYLKAITLQGLNKTLGKFPVMVVNVRYPWCDKCSSQDSNFAKAAKAAKALSKKEAQWKTVAFGVVDAREERTLGKKLGAKCDHFCSYRVFTDPAEEPVPLKEQWSESALLDAVRKYLTPAVSVVKTDSEVKLLKEANTTCFASFASESSPEYVRFKRTANLLRGELIFAAKFGKAGPVELSTVNGTAPFTFDGTMLDNGSGLVDWIRPRSVPLLQAWEGTLRERYENMKLPMAKLWLDEKEPDSSLNDIVRESVRQVAKKYLGRIAFVEQSKSSYSYDLRNYGLTAPEVYPAFGIASNASFDSLKYGFEGASLGGASTAQEFWKDSDRVQAALASFCDQVLAGSWPLAHESATPEANWTSGNVKKLTWKTYGEIRAPEKPLLLEIYRKYRRENEKKEKQAENLAKALVPYAEKLTVASFDTSVNYLPPEDFKREQHSMDTEWYYIPAAVGSSRGPPVKLTKPSKDAPIKKVVAFAAKMVAEGIDVKTTMESFEQWMTDNPPPAGMDMPDIGGMGMPDMGGMDMPDMGGMDMPGMGGMEADMGDMTGAMAGMPGIGSMGAEL